MVAEFLKNKHYELRWRFEFFENLQKISHINDLDYAGRYHKNDAMESNNEFWYLKSMADFNICMGERLSSLVKNGVQYVDLVCEGCPNNNGNTYSYLIYWENSFGDILVDCKGKDGVFSEKGLYQFSNEGLPLHTKVIENRRVYVDYIHGFFWNEKNNEEDLDVAILPYNHQQLLRV